MIRLGYNTNGFPHHRLELVARVLSDVGYRAIAITPDVFHAPPTPTGLEEARALGPVLQELDLAVAVETGARFALDPLRKHQPTLLSPGEGAGQRLEMLRRWHELAELWGAETFSFWSGSPEDDAGDDAWMDRLCAGAEALLAHAGGEGPRVCFEPEPGMFVDSHAQLERFLERLARPELAVMLDVGHVPVTESIAPQQAIRDLASRLGGVQLDDSRGGVHEHLAPGDGELDFDAIFAALREVGFEGLACLELPRHGHDPVRAARAAHAALAPLV